MLVARRALRLARWTTWRAPPTPRAALAARHRDTLMAGRTLLQQALPITFGLKAAGWLAGLDDRRGRWPGAGRDCWPSSSAARPGRWRRSGRPWPRSLGRFAAELGLAAPALPWHTERARLGRARLRPGRAAGRVARSRATSSCSPRPRSARSREGRRRAGAARRRCPEAQPGRRRWRSPPRRPGAGLVPPCSTRMVQEHERAAGGWHAEWEPLRDLFGCAGRRWSRELPARASRSTRRACGPTSTPPAGCSWPRRRWRALAGAARPGPGSRPGRPGGPAAVGHRPAAGRHAAGDARGRPPPGPGRGGGRPRPRPVPRLGPGPHRPGPGRPRLMGRRLRGPGSAAPGRTGSTASTLARMLANRRIW